MSVGRPDHRPAVAAQRREKMRARLVEAGLLVIAAKGHEHTVIEDVIARAGVARGTFYNHFASVDDLAEAARDALVDELLQLSLDAVATIDDPAEACAKSLRLALGLSSTYPLLARFSVQLSTNMVQCDNLVTHLVPPLLLKGMEMGRFCRMPADLAVDNISAMAIVALQWQAEGKAPDVAQIIAAVLRMLGLPREEAEALAVMEVPAVTPDPQGLIVQSDAAMRGQV